MCVEFVAAVAWLAELFPDPQEREKALGFTQAFSSIGGLMVAVASGIAVQYSQHWWPIGIPGLISVEDPHAPWRYTLMSGIIPALPLIIIRPFLPESPVWAQRQKAGTLKRPSIAALFSPELRRITIVTAVGFACTLGIAFGAIQQMPQIVPGLADVREQAKIASEEAIAAAKEKGETNEKKLEIVGKAAAGRTNQLVASEYTKMQEVGGLIGRFIMALVLASSIAWGWKLRMFQIPGLIITPLLFYYFVRATNTVYYEIPLKYFYLGTIPISTMSIGMFLMGLFTVGQLSFWGNYLPHMYPVHLRGTGESFAANIGGRMIGVFAAALTGFVATLFTYAVDSPALRSGLQYSTAAAIVGTSIYLIGFVASFFLPEPSGDSEH